MIGHRKMPQMTFFRQESHKTTINAKQQAIFFSYGHELLKALNFFLSFLKTLNFERSEKKF